MASVGEWYYIGHYGQLGPLTRPQIDELVEGEVVARDTYVWKVGMANWVQAGQVVELSDLFRTKGPTEMPPPPPGPPLAPTMPPPNRNMERSPVFATYPHTYGAIKSDKSRVLAGILQLLIPGVGRIYLGYAAIGVLQLIFSLCGVGWLWSFIDGIYILGGGTKTDGFGRQLGN